MCNGCKSPDTILSKENRLFFLRCEQVSSHKFCCFSLLDDFSNLDLTFRLNILRSSSTMTFSIIGSFTSVSFHDFVLILSMGCLTTVWMLSISGTYQSWFRCQGWAPEDYDLEGGY